ncbi:OPA3 family protein [Megaselia abdita]
MVVGAFPAAKLGILAIKQISKPIATLLKNNAKQSPFFRRYVCMPPAQFYNWVEVKTKMWSMNLGKPVAVPPLNEAMATELGANLLGEAVIFGIGAGLLIWEYVRSSNKEAKKEEDIRIEKENLYNSLSDLQFRVEKQEAQIKTLTRHIADLDSKWFFTKKITLQRTSLDQNIIDIDVENEVKSETLIDRSIFMCTKMLF